MTPGHHSPTAAAYLQKISKHLYLVEIELYWFPQFLITDWSTQASPITIAEWSQQAGPQVPLPHDPLELFSLFFDDSLVSMIVDETSMPSSHFRTQKKSGQQTDQALPRHHDTNGYQ